MQKSDENTVVKELITNVRKFLRERDWEKYHNPKDLAESICIESAELLQLFQWQTPNEVAALENDLAKVEQIR
ncbi:MAG: nucleotide pyrophosphohydrolase, partial [Candidatus Bathyarchaeota archaeon]